MKYYDVTRPIKDKMMVYPGDLPVEIKRSKTIEKDGYNWSRISSGTHIGTHMDAPVHFIKGGKTLDEFPIDLMISKATVVETQAEMIDKRTLLSAKIKNWEVLFFKTKNQKLWGQPDFSTDFVSLTEDGARLLVEKGTRLVGIDYMSIETHHTHEYPVHKLLLGRGIYIIEGLILNDVPAGSYDLYCFPMKLAKGDGGPVRVLLGAR